MQQLPENEDGYPWKNVRFPRTHDFSASRDPGYRTLYAT